MVFHVIAGNESTPGAPGRQFNECWTGRHQSLLRNETCDLLGGVNRGGDDVIGDLMSPLILRALSQDAHRGAHY
jgi:hypothetical protein